MVYDILKMQAAVFIFELSSFHRGPDTALVYPEACPLTGHTSQNMYLFGYKLGNGSRACILFTYVDF